MGKKSYQPPPAAPPPSPPGAGCEPEPPPTTPPVACEPSTPPEPTPPAAQPGPDLTGLLGVLPDISISGDAGLLAPDAGISAVLPVDISLSDNASSSGGLEINLSPVEASTPGEGLGSLLNVGDVLGGGSDEGSLPLVSLDSETDAAIEVPVFGDAGVLGGNVEAGSLLSIGSLFGGSNGGAADVGSLLNAAMLGVSGSDSMGAIPGADVYDGNVPLVGGLSSALGSTLDLLTTTSSLFDVPALDIIGCDSLDG